MVLHYLGAYKALFYGIIVYLSLQFIIVEPLYWFYKLLSEKQYLQGFQNVEPKIIGNSGLFNSFTIHSEVAKQKYVELVNEGRGWCK